MESENPSNNEYHANFANEDVVQEPAKEWQPPAMDTPQPPNPYFYKDPTFRTRAVQVLLYFGILVWIVALVSGYLEYQLLNDMQNGAFSSEDEMMIAINASDTRQGFLGLIQMVLAITTMVFFMMWVHRANNNTRALTNAPMEYTPGWAVGWFFVPVACLWIPYRVIKEIWQVSASHCREQQFSGYGLIGFWWFFWLISNVMGQMSFRLQMDAEELDEFIRISAISMASDGIDIVSKGLTLFLIWKIATMHEQIIEEIRNTAFIENPY